MSERELPTTMHLFRESKQRFETAKRDTESRLDRDLRNSDMLEILLEQFEIEEVEESDLLDELEAIDTITNTDASEASES